MNSARGREAVGFDLPPAGPELRVQHAVDDQGPHLAGEQVRVGVAEVGAVREPEVGEAPIAHRLPQQIQVPRDVGRAHVRGDACASAQAARGQRVGELKEGAHLLGQVRERGRPREEGGLRLVAVEALQRLGRGDPARVEADDVEAPLEERPQVLPEPADDETHARPSRTAGVDEHGADPVHRVGRRNLRQRDAGRRSSGLVVVERHLRDGAGDPRKVVPTRRPGQRGNRRPAAQLKLPLPADLVVAALVQILPGATAEKNDGRAHASQRSRPRAAHQPSSLIRPRLHHDPSAVQDVRRRRPVVHRRTPDNGRPTPCSDETRLRRAPPATGPGGQGMACASGVKAGAG